MTNADLCPCGTNKLLADCCGALIYTKRPPNSPEQLMRSRYTAYVLDEYQYIYDTYSKNSRKSLSIDDLQRSAMDTIWCRLEVTNTSDTASEESYVEFIAYYMLGGKAYAMHERSRFIVEDKVWRYVDGEMLAKTGKLAIGRNEVCLCASGKKFKRCCGK